ncbi:hypothetical protein AB0G86_18770 [Streptomyces scabiei]|uniref:hypothetical protein n=1 Tax=Streptomyces scabiei TaxID=1930 RepID=UPI0033E1E46B
MTHQPSDSVRLADVLAEHDRAHGNTPDPDGKIAGYDQSPLLSVAKSRSRMMFEDRGPLRKVLAPEHHEELIQLMAAMWQDGFAAGARSEQADA